MPNETLRLCCGNTIMWYDGPVVSWATLHESGQVSTGLIQDLPREAPHDQILAIFSDEQRRRFQRNEICLRQLMDQPDTRLWGVDLEEEEHRLAPMSRPVHDDFLPDPDLFWSALTGNDRARRSP